MHGTDSSTPRRPDGGLVIRRCLLADVEIIESREPPGRGYACSTFARQEAGFCDYLVAWLHSTPVGSGELERGTPPELKNLHVDPASRGEGVGTALIGAFESLAAESGRMRLGVSEDNLAALRLYARLGYRPTGQSSTYSYRYVDDDGEQGAATETSVLLERSLAD